MYIPQQFNSIFHEKYSKLEPFIEYIGTEVIMKRISLFLCVYRPPNADFDEFINTVTDILLQVYNDKFQEIHFLEI